MERSVVVVLASLLATKMLADLLRRAYGYDRPNALARARRAVEIDPAYVLMLCGVGVAAFYAGPEGALAIAIAMRIGQIAIAHVLLSSNHSVLELLLAIVFLRLLDQPAALASTVQAATLSVWLYAAFQKLYHGQFTDGLFFYVAFRTGEKHGKYAALPPTARPLGEYYGPFEPASHQHCRRVAALVLATEILSPLCAFAANGTVLAPLLLLAVIVPVGITTGETNFMLTNMLLSVFFIAPFDLAALLRIVNDPVVVAIVAWLIVWPPLHAVLTRRWRFNSWKLYGWGMYATLLPRIQVIDSGGELADAPKRPAGPFRLLETCGACELRWLSNYARRLFFRSCYPTSARGLVFSWYRRRGAGYLTNCVVLWNAPGARPITFEIGDDASAAEFKRYVASATAWSEHSAA